MSIVPLAAIATRAIGALERTLSSGARVLRDGTHGILATALDRPERQQLGTVLYEAHLQRVRDVLAPWELDWLDEDLPSPPARVLVGGAGAGREVAALRAMGHFVGGLEPGPTAVERCRDVAGSGAPIARGTYEDLSAAVLDGAAHEEVAGIAAERWDAVLLGWTSMMHVLDPAERVRLFVALDQLCRGGPILGTFYPPERARSGGRLRTLGNVIGRAIARARGGVQDPGEDESFGFTCGFLRVWSTAEVEAVASRIGRRTLWRGEGDGCLRFTMIR